MQHSVVRINASVIKNDLKTNISIATATLNANKQNNEKKSKTMLHWCYFRSLVKPANSLDVKYFFFRFLQSTIVIMFIVSCVIKMNDGDDDDNLKLCAKYDLRAHHIRPYLLLRRWFNPITIQNVQCKSINHISYAYSLFVFRHFFWMNTKANRSNKTHFRFRWPV